MASSTCTGTFDPRRSQPATMESPGRRRRVWWWKVNPSGVGVAWKPRMASWARRGAWDQWRWAVSGPV